MSRVSDASLVIGIAGSPAERVQLARLLVRADAVLLVSSAEQARAFLDRPHTVAPVPDADLVVSAGLSLDADRRVVRWQDREVALTRLEHDVLQCLVTSPGQIWTHQRLHLAVWGNEHLGRGSHIHSVVKRLRRKLAWLGAMVTIHAVRGVGFRLAPG